ncbi:uncharacterized protein LOC124716770 [Schistocerca piceifrons]|uniref:uncharacterized protein LOC124716770 n=1 Tax=Schistocerca piceifrons TaxID=274613 RepID=UPI001F5F875B|nr:uncharacterized protein LOC124716770 [Schistocerca piceifrons]
MALPPCIPLFQAFSEQQEKWFNAPCAKCEGSHPTRIVQPAQPPMDTSLAPPAELMELDPSPSLRQQLNFPALILVPTMDQAPSLSSSSFPLLLSMLPFLLFISQTQEEDVTFAFANQIHTNQGKSS